MSKCNIKMNHCSIITIKLAVIAFVFIVLNLWDGLAKWVFATNIWWFVGAFVLLMLKLGVNCKCVHEKVIKKTIKKKPITKKK
jgi:hypothetical protein